MERRHNSYCLNDETEVVFIIIHSSLILSLAKEVHFHIYYRSKMTNREKYKDSALAKPHF